MSTTFTEREIKLLAAACQCFEGQPKLDLEKFSAMSGLTKGSARNAWAALKKKFSDEPGQTGAPASTTTAGKSGKKRPPPVSLPTRKATKEGDDNSDEPSPTKKTRLAARSKVKGKAAKTKVEDDDKTVDSENDEDEEEDGFVKVKDEATDEC